MIKNAPGKTMKKLLLNCCAFLVMGCTHAEPTEGDRILQMVRDHLPSDPLTLAGSLKVKARNGYVQASLPVEMELDWGAATPKAVYRIGGESLEITWSNDRPAYRFSNPKNAPTGKILDTGITWADLSFSVLWWSGARLAGEEKKINRDCHVVEVPVPGSEETMRLWIEKNMGMLLEAQTLDAQGKEVRRLRIESIKKMDGMWVAKDLEIRDTATGSRTILQINDLQWKNPKPTAVAFDPAESVNRFSIDLYRKLAGTSGENLFCSPCSIASALAMAYGGARGETAAQMEAVLHLGGQEATHPAFAYLRTVLNEVEADGHVNLSMANSLWPQQDHVFLPEYLDLAKNAYGSEIRPVDFKSNAEGARQAINGWAELQTKGMIRDLIPEGMLDPLTRLVLANAIHFKGSWASRFDPQRTRPAPFTLGDGPTIEVPAMFQTADFGLALAEGYRALELPYEGGDLSMLVLLPDQPDGLARLEKGLATAPLYDLEFHKTECFVQLPRFKLESEFELGRLLASMGMPLAFSDAADFSGMDGARDLFIDEVVHKAVVEVNEEGTEAAAATAVVARATSMPPQFVADHPFLFLIRENTSGAILFIGRVADPR